MWRKIRIVSTILTLAGCLHGAGAATSAQARNEDISNLTEVRMSQLQADPLKYDRNILKIRGYLRNKPHNIPRLYPSRAAALQSHVRDAIDLIPGSTDVRGTLHAPPGIHCVIVGGIFRAYTDNYFGFGSAASKYGGMRVLGVAQC